MADGPTLIPLDNVDPALVEALLDRAFEPERHKRTAYKVREGTDWLPGLSFAAIDADEHLVGTIQCWPVALTDPDGRRHPLIMVGPVAVEPAAQGAGYGKALMTASLAALSPGTAAAGDDWRSGILRPVLGLHQCPYRGLGPARPIRAPPAAGALRQSGGPACTRHVGPLARVS